VRNSGVGEKKVEFSWRREEEGKKFWCREEEGLSSLGEERRKTKEFLPVVYGEERIEFSCRKEEEKKRETFWCREEKGLAFLEKRGGRREKFW
jgi:hypothetical protein